jgi:hypothetical protein
LTLKPLLYIIFCASLLRPSARRAFNLGMARSIGLALMVLALADLGFGIAFGAHWGALFAAGIMAVAPPYFLAAAFIAVFTLAILSNGDGQPARDRLGLPYRFWTVVLTLFAAQAFVVVLYGACLYASLVGFKWAMPLSAPLLKAVGSLLVIFPHKAMLALFALASLWLIVQDRRNGRTDQNLGNAPLAAT